MFKPSLDYTKPAYKADAPQAFFMIDKRTGDRRLVLCLPIQYDTSVFEVVPLGVMQGYEIKPHVYKYEIKPTNSPPTRPHINRITDCFKNVDLG